MAKDRWRMLLLAISAASLAIFVLWGWALTTIGR